MSKDLNQCNFIGRLGQSPEIKNMPSGDAVANFSIACGDDYKDKQGQKVEQTNWVRCVAFGRQAEVIGEYLTKGSKVFISGKQVTRKWQNKEGQDVYTTEINLTNMQMLDSKGDNQGQQQGGYGGQQQAPAQQAPMPADDFDDDIPF